MANLSSDRLPIDTAAGEKRNVYLRGRLPREWAAADYNPLTQGLQAGTHRETDSELGQI